MSHSWFGDPTQPPAIGLPTAQIAEIVAHELRDMPLPAYPVALQPFVVPRRSAAEMLGAARGLLALLRTTMLQLAPTRSGRLAALGLDPADCPYWTDDDAFEERHCADIARADVVIGPDGPRFVEMNVSGAIGGMVHFSLYQRAWRRIREAAGQPSFVGVDPFSALADLVGRTCAELSVPPEVALVGTPREWGHDTSTRTFDLQVDELRQHGIHAEHVEFEQLHEHLGLPGTPRHPLGIAEFTLHDAQVGGYDVGPVQAAVDQGFRVLPSASSWLVHTKKLLALASEGQPWMGAAERDLVERYVPWTRLVRDRKVLWRSRRHELADLLVEHRADFVLKGATGDAGREVVFGSRTAPEAWATLIEQVLDTDTHVVQEVVPSPTYPVDVLDSPSGTPHRVLANTVLSPFVIGGTPAGCFARFVPDREPGIISALSKARLGCLLAGDRAP